MCLSVSPHLLWYKRHSHFHGCAESVSISRDVVSMLLKWFACWACSQTETVCVYECSLLHNTGSDTELFFKFKKVAAITSKAVNSTRNIKSRKKVSSWIGMRRNMVPQNCMWGVETQLSAYEPNMTPITNCLLSQKCTVISSSAFLFAVLEEVLKSVRRLVALVLFLWLSEDFIFHVIMEPCLTWLDFITETLIIVLCAGYTIADRSMMH